MSVLALTDEARAEIARVVAYAEQHVISWTEIQARATGAISGRIGDDPDRYCLLPVGFRCVFNLEMQRAIQYRHLSVSINRKGKLPHPAVVSELAKLFGFPRGIDGDNIALWREEIPGGVAINLIEPT